MQKAIFCEIKDHKLPPDSPPFATQNAVIAKTRGCKRQDYLLHRWFYSSKTLKYRDIRQ